VVLVLDLARDAAGVVERSEDQVAAGQRQVGGEHRALLAFALLGDLDHDRLAAFEDLLDLRVPRVLRLEVERLLHDVADGEEAVSLAAVLDEGGVQAGLDRGDGAPVDVAADEAAIGDLDLVVLQGRVADDRQAHFLRALGVDQHAAGHGVSFNLSSRWVECGGPMGR
jgi:hypothetical protein